MIKRFDWTILNNFSLLVSRNQQDWDLKLILHAHRSTVREISGYIPSQMLFSSELSLPCYLFFWLSTRYPFITRGIPLRSSGMFWKHSQLCSKVDYLGKRENEYEIQYQSNKTWILGLWLSLVMESISWKRFFPKLQSNWGSPYTVLKKLNDAVAQIQKLSSSKQKVVHYDRLALYCRVN